MSTPPANFSPVTQVLDPSAPAPPEEKVSEEQFNLLHASSVTYRDLLIFEERLKLNMFRLRKRQQKYEVLWIFNMHFNRDNRPELSFFRKVPKKFQEGFSAYKASYFKRRAEKRAAAALAKAKGGLAASSGGTGAGGMMNATGMNRTASGQNRRLHSGVASRGRRVAGSGSASGSDSGAARSSTSSNRALGSSRFSDEGVRPLRSLTATSPSSSQTMSSSSKTTSTAAGSDSK
ncbi:hypothetical protein BGZ51_001900 [Haplosporangium sp. Z 767]|nr:hypothetical protein BGZ50_009738 [Haplosporangium sp. Z 11]KAF9193914.1 hypothetical protein BGZ51_001900 [Haplosporangium sp. Z 767]